jgi:hypothetical protein
MTGQASRPTRRSAVKAKAGDKIVVKGHHIGEPDRDGVILEVRGADGEPPYVVRWAEDGHEGLFFPSTDASVVHYEASEPN